MEQSLCLSPSLASGLWSRHTLHLIAGRHTAALQDLRAIITSSPTPSAPSAPSALSASDRHSSESGYCLRALLALAEQLKRNGITAAAIPLLTKVHLIAHGHSRLHNSSLFTHVHVGCGNVHVHVGCGNVKTVCSHMYM